MQVQDSVPSEQVICEAHIPRTDFLVAVIGMVYLSSHYHLHENKRSKQDNRHSERDFVHRHNSKSGGRPSLLPI